MHVLCHRDALILAGAFFLQKTGWIPAKNTFPFRIEDARDLLRGVAHQEGVFILN